MHLRQWTGISSKQIPNDSCLYNTTAVYGVHPKQPARPNLYQESKWAPKVWACLVLGHGLQKCERQPQGAHDASSQSNLNLLKSLKSLPSNAFLRLCTGLFSGRVEDPKRIQLWSSSLKLCDWHDFELGTTFVDCSLYQKLRLRSGLDDHYIASCPNVDPITSLKEVAKNQWKPGSFPVVSVLEMLMELLQCMTLPTLNCAVANAVIGITFFSPLVLLWPMYMDSRCTVFAFFIFFFFVAWSFSDRFSDVLEFLLISFPIIVKANCCTCLRGRVLKWNRWHRQSQLQVCSLQNGINAIETNVYTYIQIPLSYIYVCIYIYV